MKILIGKLIGEKIVMTGKEKNYKARLVSVQEEGHFTPTIIQVNENVKIVPDKAGVVEIFISCSAWDDRAKKFTAKAVKFYGYDKNKSLV